MRNLLTVIAVMLMSWMSDAQAQSLTVDPESIVPLPDKFDIEMPAPDVPPEIARFHGAWIGTWGDDNRHILVVERVQPDGRADVVFAHADSAYYGMYREWFRSRATIADGVLTFPAIFTAASVTLRFAFEGPDRLYETATYRPEGVRSGTLVRADVARLAAHDLPIEWPGPGERVSIPHLTVRTPDGARPIMLEATLYRPAGSGPAPLAIITHGADAGRNQLRTWSALTEAHWLRDKGFSVLVLMRRGRGRSEGINGEENFGRDREGSLVDLSAGIAEAVEDLASAIAYGRKLPNVRPGPVLVSFSGGWYPYAPVTTPDFAKAGRGAANKIPQLWLYADNDRLYDEAMIRGYYQAFVAAGGSARFELLHGIPGDGHLLRLYPDRWRPIADQFLAKLNLQGP